MKRWVAGAATVAALVLSILGWAVFTPAAGAAPTTAPTCTANASVYTCVPADTATTTDAKPVAAIPGTPSANDTPGAATPSAAAADAPTGGLAFTGADIVGIVVIGALLLGGGTLVVVLSRRRSAAP